MGRGVELNRPEVHDEVTRAFESYDAALLAGDVETLNDFFVDGPLATRFGIGQELYGSDQIAAWRRLAPPLVRAPLRRYDVVTLDNDVAVVTAEWDEGEPSNVVGRQTQTWVRAAAGWRVLSGHVSTRAVVNA
ncbi:hypothetical protein acdb102_25200 [Acidothermaceae bacterium B102]|nr:hypothetical protein acdb102_25200 [Acidothermaceae bacterium B102]